MEEYIWDLNKLCFNMTALQTVIEEAGDKSITIKNIDKHILLEMIIYIKAYSTFGKVEEDIKTIKNILLVRETC